MRKKYETRPGTFRSILPILQGIGPYSARSKYHQ